MSGRHLSSACVAAAVAVFSLNAGPARAEGLFEFLFGKAGGNSQQASASVPTPITSRPMSITVRPRVAGIGHGTAFCVRMCDGRYFPIQRSAAVQPAQICNSLCPATKTRVFAGPDISRAVAADGTHYSAIDNAFLYRQDTVDDCTCNGVTAYGLATMDARDDPTLRAGDLIATPAGLVRSSALSTQRAAARRDEEIITSSLPLGMRGNLAESEDLELRGSTLQEGSGIVKPATRPSRAKRAGDLFAERKRTR